MLRQASVNPKVETVDDLVNRRKALHVGMCKLLHDDLAYISDIALEVVAKTKVKVLEYSILRSCDQ